MGLQLLQAGFGPQTLCDTVLGSTREYVIHINMLCIYIYHILCIGVCNYLHIITVMQPIVQRNLESSIQIQKIIQKIVSVVERKQESANVRMRMIKVFKL